MMKKGLCIASRDRLTANDEQEPPSDGSLNVE